MRSSSASKRCKPFEAALDIGQVRAGDPVGIVAGSLRIVREPQQIADGLDRKPQLAGVADEAQALQVVRAVGAVVARRAAGVGQEPDPLVVADRLDLGRSRRREITDPELFVHLTLTL